MNKPITTRVQQAVNGNRGVQEPLLHVGVVAGNAAARKGSPLKKTEPSLGGMFEGTTKGLPNSLSKVPTFQTYSAADAITDSAEKPAKKPGLIAQGRASGGNSSLISGAKGVAGDSKTIPRATDANAAASTAASGKSGSTGSTTVAEAFQKNMAARVDKAGELGRARRDARRAKKSGASSAPTTRSAEALARDKRVDAVIGSNSSSSALDFKPPSVDLLASRNTNAAAQPSAQDIRKEGRAERKSSRKASRADRVSENKANRASNAQKRQDKLTMKQNKRQDKRQGDVPALAGKSASISVNNKGAQLKTPSLGTRSTTNASNKDYNEALMSRMNANEDAALSAGLAQNNKNAPMGSESALQMRMDANVGVKSKSPMKKGYFKGM